MSMLNDIHDRLPARRPEHHRLAHALHKARRTPCDPGTTEFRDRLQAEFDADPGFKFALIAEAFRNGLQDPATAAYYEHRAAQHGWTGHLQARLATLAGQEPFPTLTEAARIPRDGSADVSTIPSPACAPGSDSFGGLA